jgi:hypothetical protein
MLILTALFKPLRVFLRAWASTLSFLAHLLTLPGGSVARLLWAMDLLVGLVIVAFTLAQSCRAARDLFGALP